MLFRRHTDETSPRNFFFPRKSLGYFRRNSEEKHFRGALVCRKSPRNIPKENFVGIYIDRCVFGHIPIDQSVYKNTFGIYRGTPFLGIFRGTCPSVYSEEHLPRYIPRNISLGIFRGRCPSGGKSWNEGEAEEAAKTNQGGDRRRWHEERLTEKKQQLRK
ncbi:hypothetical protein F2Q70_00018560 [Brassica cretica]|uniref:Uncharacterized protein n=1 Tax=Brassica cretica TaxID=69181 RepID=A0A8S9I2G2_BRACR|nr:hypothetical protein F2Q70_00018560 [Brassica cretica]